MFKSDNYKPLTLRPPLGGLNTQVAKELQGENYAYLLDNLVPEKAGYAIVRGGTKNLTGAVLPNTEYKQLLVSPFVTQDDVTQLVIYAIVPKTDDTAQTFTIISTSQIKFKTKHMHLYVPAARIKIFYSSPGGNSYVLSSIHSVSEVDEEGFITVTIKDNFFPANIEVLNVVRLRIDSGDLFKFVPVTKQITKIEHTSVLGALVSPHTTTFNRTMIICNGINSVLTWDGTKLAQLFDPIQEQIVEGSVKVAQDRKTLSFILQPDISFSEDLYAVKKQFTVHKTDRNGKTQILGPYDIFSSAYEEKERKVTVTLSPLEVFPFPEEVADARIYVHKELPAFNSIYVINDRLVALSPGETSLLPRRDGLRIYYTSQPNRIDTWYDRKTKTLSYINLEAKQGIVDAIETIKTSGEYTLFIGRRRTQVWTGYSWGENGDFRWVSNIEGGVYHRDLLLPFGTDLALMSTEGFKTLSSLNTSKQVQVTSSVNIDPLISSYIESTKNDNGAYLNCRSFIDNTNGYYGFKIGNNPVLLFKIIGEQLSWFRFKGSFEIASTFSFYNASTVLALGNKLTYYTGGFSKDSDYNDNNSPIQYAISLPYVSLDHKIFNSKYVQVKADSSSSYFKDDRNIMTLTIYGENVKIFNTEIRLIPEYIGDVMGDVPLGTVEAVVSRGYRMGIESLTPITPLRFKSSAFFGIVSGTIINTKLTLKSVTLFGK